MDIIKRLLYYSDKEMYDYCLSLFSVVDSHRFITVGRGKAKKQVKVLTYKTDPNVVDRIKRSIEYYKNLINEKTN